jgi:hypothetical protein
MGRKRYVEVTASALIATLVAIGQKITAKGGSFFQKVEGKERVFDFVTPHTQVHFRVFTSLGVGDDAVRACGEDAVRIVHFIWKSDSSARDGLRFAPVSKSRKILRTAPNDIHPDDREKVFLDRLTEALRDAYRQAATHPVCPKCGSVMALRTPKRNADKQYKPFYGCSNYPECRATKAA